MFQVPLILLDKTRKGQMKINYICLLVYNVYKYNHIGLNNGVFQKKILITLREYLG